MADSQPIPEFRKFEELARKLVAVPKREVDKKRQRIKAQGSAKKPKTA